MNPEDSLLAQLSYPAASPHQPSFITAPGETDVLMVVMGVVLLLFVLMVGNLYFRLHALPDRLGGKKVQYEIAKARSSCRLTRSKGHQASQRSGWNARL